MSDGILAQLRRLYHHAVNGGTVSADDIALVIQSLEREQIPVVVMKNQFKPEVIT